MGCPRLSFWLARQLEDGTNEMGNEPEDAEAVGANGRSSSKEERKEVQT